MSAMPKTPTIRSIRELAGRSATWRQPSQLRQEYELAVGDEVVATLRWRKNVGTTAVARAPDGTWSFKAAGFLNPRVSIRLSNSDYDFATFRARNTGEGVLEAMGDQHFHWRCSNFWQNGWSFHNNEGDRLLSLRPDNVAAKVSGTLAIDAKGGSYQEIGYMAVLAWYLFVLMADDMATGQSGA
jgi:hypothetical protein